MKKRSFFTGVLFFVCFSVSAQQNSPYEYQQFVDRIMALQDSVDVYKITKIADNEGNSARPPFEIEIDRSIFDLENYLSAYDKLDLQAPGMRPVCVYYYTRLDGCPQIFLLPDTMSLDSLKASSRMEIRSGIYISTLDAYIKSHPISSKFQAEDSPMGYFQLAVWKLIGQRFALFWHNNYGKMFVVCTPEVRDAMPGIFEKSWAWSNLTTEQREAICRIDPTPVIRMEDDRCIVRVVVVMPFGGFRAVTFSISRRFPHIMEETSNEVLLPYRSDLWY